jgi:tetrahydromethanopterin S-methyltransferase subunit G
MTQGKDPQTEKKLEVSQTTENKPEEKKGGIGRKIGWIVGILFLIVFVVLLIINR